MSVVVAITGASGAVYAQRLLERLAEAGTEVWLTVSRHGAEVLERELGVAVDLEHFDASALASGAKVRYFHCDDLTAPCASGSAAWEAMVVSPCSMGTAGRLAAGVSEDLVTRAGDVCLKERRPLLLVVRETPLSVIHLRNLLALAEAGATVLPAAPPFYHGPKSISDLVDGVVDRVLDHLGLPRSGAPRWTG